MDALLKFYVNRVVAKIKKQSAEEKPGRKKEDRKNR